MKRSLFLIPTFAAAVVTFINCKPALTDADQIELAKEGVQYAVCKSVASECGEDAGAPAKPAPQCWAVFDACLAGAGITITHSKKDGGK